MGSILTVTTPATDVNLLTVDEVRAATGVASGRDADMTRVQAAVTAAIVSRCRVRSDGENPPTLMTEGLSESFRLAQPSDGLALSRRPVTEISAVTECGVALADGDYEYDPATGILVRLSGEYPAWWAAGKVIVEYSAGFDAVPPNLKSAGMKLATVLWTEEGRESGLKSIDVPGVISREYWVGASSDPLIDREIDDLLADYINPVVA